MIRDVTATAEIGKTYLGTVVRIAEFGAFVEIFPAPTACCTSAKSPNSASATVRDELKEGDQVLVKVLAIEGNKIRLSRKAILREQRDKQAKARSRKRKIQTVVRRRVDSWQREIKKGGDRRLPFCF